MKIYRKCHNQEAQPSRGTKRGRDEEQIRASPHMKPQAKKNYKQKNRLGSVNRKTVVGGVKMISL